MGSTTPLFEQHQEAGAKIVDFGGWDMPLHYGSQIGEHIKVRQDLGMFDVSHMTLVDIKGAGSKAMLVKLLANDVRKLTEHGRALYSAMLNEEGCILDDLIVYANGDDYLMVVNCGTREKDLSWIDKQAESFDCSASERLGFAIIALQGPKAIPLVEDVVGDEVSATIKTLKPYQGQYCGRWFVARTGYTGEKGLEIILPADDAVQLWSDLSEKGVQPVGLGARDTLRLEAGMNLYGSDMDESVTPLNSNMAATVVMDDHEFIGKAALQEQLKRGVENRLVGLVMTSKGVLRAHYPVFCDGHEVGEITSGAFSPSLQHSIALARLSETQGELTVAIRGKHLVVREVTLPFIRNGQQTYKTQ